MKSAISCQSLKSPTSKQRLAKLISFVQYHRIDTKQIWDDGTFLTISQFANIMEQKFDYKLDTQQLLGLKNIAQNNQLLHIQNFHFLGLWVSIFYEQKYNINNKQNQLHQRQQKRPQTACKYSRKYNQHQKTEKTFKKVQKVTLTQTVQQKSKIIDEKEGFSRLNLHSSNFCLNSNVNQSSLSKNSRLKFKQAEEQLERKIIQNALDKKWEYLVKVGDMNSWIRQLGKNQRFVQSTIGPLTKSQKNVNANNTNISNKYQINKQSNENLKLYKIEGNQQDIKIYQQKQNGNCQLLPLKVFDQKYQLMKKKVTNEQKLKNNMKGTMLLVLDKLDKKDKVKINKSKLNQKISQRDQELNYLLLQIMRLKNIFQQQDQILTQCGVNM